MELSEKQIDVLDCIANEDPTILICSGAKRAGKTYVLNIAFLAHIAQFEGQKVKFIIGGATEASIRRNILEDWEKILGREIKLNKHKAFKLFGNLVYCFDGSTSDAWKKARGFEAHGAFLNEGTALHNTFVKEVFSRCSGAGSRIYIDTNPENPSHFIKEDLINNDGQLLPSGRLNIKVFNFRLWDNNFLDRDYIDSIIASTPQGMFYERDIEGNWVASQGVVYTEYHRVENIISVKDYEKIKIKKYFVGVDWGWEHHGSMVVLAKDFDDNIYLIEEIAHQHKNIDWWVQSALDIKARYGDIWFYVDSARQEYKTEFLKAKLKAINADKSVIAGISLVSSLMKLRQFKIVEGCAKKFDKEIYNYRWKVGKDEPIKSDDDVLDAIRYAIFTEKKLHSKERKVKSR